MNVLPVIHLESLRTGGDTSRCAEAIRAASERHGFFYVAGHGVDPALERRLEEETVRFFSLPLAAKERVAMKHGGRAWRGWFPLEGELTSGRPDLKEGLYLGEELGPDDPRVRADWPLHGRNLFPVEQPALRAAVLDFIAAQTRVGHLVMRGLALSLGLDADFFERSLTRQPLPLFRIFHYPAPRDAAQTGAWGVGEHTDYGLLTVLKQDDCGGLEVKTPEGWIDAPPVPGTFVCNLGDMLDRMTGGRYRSTPHRVRNQSGRSRYSWPFFFDPAFDAKVAPLPGALVRPASQDAAERWDRASVHTIDGTYGDYLLSKVSKVFPELAQRVVSSTLSGDEAAAS
jgi:isopenicillin N synthase-like dioxygenase